MRVQIIVPFDTLRTGALDADGKQLIDEPDHVHDDQDYEAASVHVFAEYAAMGAEDAAKYLEAAEILGLRAQYDSGEANDDSEHLGRVTILLRGVVVE